MAILRGLPPDESVELARRCWDGGIDLVEVPAQGDRGLAALEAVVAAAGDRPVAAGTVTSVDLARRAAAAGAVGLVAPNVDEALCEWAREQSLPLLPGVMTPTELQRALAAGCSAVKVFPANVVGPSHFAALRPVFPGAQLVATGGVSPVNALDFVAEGAAAVAFGSSVLHFLEQPDLVRRVIEAITAPWLPTAPENRSLTGDPA